MTTIASRKKNILVTGATGDVGLEVILSLMEINSPHLVVVGKHSLPKGQKMLQDLPNLEFRFLDFTQSTQSHECLINIDSVLLLRHRNSLTFRHILYHV